MTLNFDKIVDKIRTSSSGFARVQRLRAQLIRGIATPLYFSFVSYPPLSVSFSPRNETVLTFSHASLRMAVIIFRFIIIAIIFSKYKNVCAEWLRWGWSYDTIAIIIAIYCY